VFRPAAESDLIALYDYICEREGTAVAVGYVDRIEAACLGLETFPLRGRLRTDIGSGIRTMGFERRATILYRVGRTDVTVIRILYGGRDLHRAFADL
jgi:toxin ParE1/3/4